MQRSAAMSDTTGPSQSEWTQRCIECDSRDLHMDFDGLTVVCEACETEFPAIVGADEHPPDASVKLHGPPGTGKTTQLVRRVEELLRGDYALSDMTVITYRKEMARDILSKLHNRGLVDDETLRKPWATDARNVGTLHAVCNRLVDIDPPDDLAHEKQEFCQERYDIDFSRGGNQSEPAKGELMFGARSWLLENVVDWEKSDLAPQYDQLIEKWPHHPEVADFHYAWEDWKAQAGISDFDDMLREVYEEDVAPRTSVVCADEYHDFTPLQAAIVESWREQADVEIVDGDPLQVVYSYAGADRKFWDRVDLPEILLPQSFRVPASVWRYATRALQPEHEPPSIKPKQEGGEVVEADSVELDSSGAKNDNVHAPIDFVDEYGEDAMFLTRTRSQARDVAADLRDHGVLFYGQEGTGAWNHAPKRLSIYNALQTLDGAGGPSGGYGLGAYTAEGDGDAVAGVRLDAGDLAAFLDRVPAEFITGTKSDTVPKATGSAEVVSGDELTQYVEPEFWQVFTRGADSVSELLQYNGSDAIAKALRRYDTTTDTHDLQSRVNVLTIHAAKGQEAKTVVLYDGITSKISTSMSRDERERKNEARLWYVGCTRAEQRLVIARAGWPWVYSILPDLEGGSGADDGSEVVV